MPKTLQQPSHPRRIRSDFNRDPAPSKRAKRLDHPSFRCRHLTFAKNLAFAAQQTVAAVSVSQIHSNRDGLLRPLGLRRRLRILSRTATLLHGRSPLHFECVCGSLSHPVGAGLLIPSRKTLSRETGLTSLSPSGRRSARGRKCILTGMAWWALVLYGVYFAVAFALRSWIHVRQTGALKRLRVRRFSVAWNSALLLGIAALLGLAAPLMELGLAGRLRT